MTTTTSTTTTSTTLPPVDEICDNCLDDDGNGLVDLEDPVCCDAPALDPLALRAMRIRGRVDGTAIKMVANVDGLIFDALKPSTRTLYLQVREEGEAPLVCARIDPTRFRATRRRLRFDDKQGLVPAADGIDRVRARLRRNGRLKVKAVGRGLVFPVPEPGEFYVTVGWQDLGVADAGIQCAGSLERLEAARNGLRLP